jgi:5-methylcytosine-specific restriction enzyme subunit McrC
MDTKWKLINENDEVGNYWITQWDMYQLYAYARKYHSERLYLIYPRTDAFLNPSIAPFYYHNGEGENIELIPVSYDLENDECIIF